MSGTRVSVDGRIPGRDGSALALETLRLEPGAAVDAGAADGDVLLFAFGGSGLLTLAGGQMLETGSAALVLEGERATVTAGAHGLAVVRATAGRDVDLHAAIGPRETVVAVERVEAGRATGKRSFQILFGPHNGSTRATLFVGYVPPGRAPWHYHLYDEIVWIWRGPGRYHVGGGVEELADGSAFRISPREVHVVENTREDAELVVLGLFTPAGSPSAAYLPAEAS